MYMLLISCGVCVLLLLVWALCLLLIKFSYVDVRIFFVLVWRILQINGEA